jgi:prepilin-type N-terminal cleavage/methylation domain-containing protein
MICFSKLKKNMGLPREAKRSGGFTITELIVVAAIVSVITTAVVIQQGSWNSQLAVKTQAYELTMMIRQAQVYSLGVKEDKAGVGDKFNVGYGVYLDNNNARYIYFADRNINQLYDLGEEIETKTFARGTTIKDICGISLCIYSGGGAFRHANISFFRPDPKANIMLTNPGGQKKDDPPVTITLQSEGGITYSIKVEANGQVSMQ